MSFENRIAIVSRDFAFANSLKEFLQKEKLLNDVIVKGSFSDAFFESPTDLTILDYETFETQRHARHHLPPVDLGVRPEQVEAVFASFGIASSIEALPVGL